MANPASNGDLHEDVQPQSGLPAPPSQPFDPEPERERIRGRIAQALVVLLIGVVGLVLLLILVFPDDLEELKTVLELVLSPVVTLGGTATGCYFGSNTKKT